MPRPTLPQELLDVLASLHDAGEVARLLDDLLTPAEIEAFGDRWAIVRLLAAGHSQREVRDQVGVSITTVSRGSRQLKYGTGGFQHALALLQDTENS